MYRAGFQKALSFSERGSASRGHARILRRFRVLPNVFRLAESLRVTDPGTDTSILPCVSPPGARLYEPQHLARHTNFGIIRTPRVKSCAAGRTSVWHGDNPRSGEKAAWQLASRRSSEF